MTLKEQDRLQEEWDKMTPQEREIKMYHDKIERLEKFTKAITTRVVDKSTYEDVFRHFVYIVFVVEYDDIDDGNINELQDIFQDGVYNTTSKLDQEYLDKFHAKVAVEYGLHERTFEEDF